MLSESETESKQKIRRNKVRFHCLFAFRWIPNTKTLNTQFKIWNTQLSQKEVGKYPIASNPYLELWYTCRRRCEIVIIFLPINLNMCFGCSKQLIEYPQHIFWMRNKENRFPIHSLIWRPVRAIDINKLVNPSWMMSVLKKTWKSCFFFLKIVYTRLPTALKNIDLVIFWEKRWFRKLFPNFEYFLKTGIPPELLIWGNICKYDTCIV